MLLINNLIIAGFTAPMNIAMNPKILLWVIPLAVAIALVYKTTTLPEIKKNDFIREVALSFCSGVVILALIAGILCLFEWLVIQ